MNQQAHGNHPTGTNRKPHSPLEAHFAVAPKPQGEDAYRIHHWPPVSDNGCLGADDRFSISDDGNIGSSPTHISYDGVPMRLKLSGSHDAGSGTRQNGFYRTRQRGICTDQRAVSLDHH